MGQYFWAEDEIDLKDEEWIYSHTANDGIRYFYKTGILIDDEVATIAAQLDPFPEMQPLYPLEKVERPWGTYQVLYEDDKCKIKKIIVNPNKRLSLQSHEYREELWRVLEGKAFVELDSYKTYIGDTSDYPEYVRTIMIPKKSKHRIQNIGQTLLVFIEIQTGESFSEDDIIRYEDDFGRV